MVGYQGVAPCIPVWKTGVFLSTPMPGEMELIVVVGYLKRRNNPAMTIPAELVQRLGAAKSVTVLTGAGKALQQFSRNGHVRIIASFKTANNDD